jgi:hypothetical protein
MSKEIVDAVLERQAKERNAQMKADVASVLATHAGRRLLMNLIAKGGVWSKTGSFDGDGNRLLYAAGRRDGAAEVLALCNKVACKLVELAMSENNERLQQWNEQIQNAEAKGNIEE